LGGDEAKAFEEDAIRMQLQSYLNAKKLLEETSGLLFFVTDGGRALGNTPEGAMETEGGVYAGVPDFFKSHPVYWVESSDGKIENSRQNNVNYNYSLTVSTGMGGAYSNRQTRFIAFTQDAVNSQNAIWSGMQQNFIIQLVMAAAPLAIALILLIILIAGTGRKYKADGIISSDGQTAGIYTAGVQFAALDKPWLDAGLCALICLEAAIGYFLYEAMDKAWRYGNMNWMTAICALASATMAPPVLWWILSFAKRCKAGKFWRHTLTCNLLHFVFTKIILRVCRLIGNFIRTLWAGTPLTLKTLAGGGVLFIYLFILSVGANGRGERFILSMLLTLVLTAGTLRFMHRLRSVSLGALAARGGRRDAPINIKGGELGSIAASINSISDGINEAVADRMKSERLKTELITNVSHDIRTPLTSLITYTDLLKTEGLDCGSAPEYLEILIQKAARLKTLTDDLFEASKAASGNIETNVTELDLADFIRQVLGELNERVRGSGLDVRTRLPEHAPVMADGRLLWRVVENLMSNVFKYALKGSRVYVEVAEDGIWYRLDIKNISENPLNMEPTELTERFKRGDEARGGDGSGLGLSIAQSFTQLQGGRFALSIDGDLFKATVSLPAATQ
jgi:signal transduction histidine kinase